MTHGGGSGNQSSVQMYNLVIKPDLALSRVFVYLRQLSGLGPVSTSLCHVSGEDLSVPN